MKWHIHENGIASSSERAGHAPQNTTAIRILGILVILVLAVFLAIRCGVIHFSETARGYESLDVPDVLSYSGFQAFIQEKEHIAPGELVNSIRRSLVNNTPIKTVPLSNILSKAEGAYIAVSLFAQGRQPIRWISKRGTLVDTLNRNIERIRGHQRFQEFDVANPDACRIMLEISIEECPLEIGSLTESQFTNERFEPGITGLKVDYNGRRVVYMPTDATVYSHLDLRQVLNFISNKLGIEKEGKGVTDRINLLIRDGSDWSLFYSLAFISWGNDIVPLYRGYPVPVQCSDSEIERVTEESVVWIKNNMSNDGRFLYYYDGVRNSIIDHAHPRRTEENNYYNILRHCGGIITLLRMHEYAPKQEYLDAADKALMFLSRQLREQDSEDTQAYFVYYNQKAKLGGSGIALVTFLRYYQQTRDEKYNHYIHGLAQHILSRIDSDGEMLGYYIHPGFNDGKPILNPSEDEKKSLFSFYYPGEALLGLALYYQEMQLENEYKNRVKHDIARALDFLIYQRPVKYREMFQPLPSDGWLMQAIEQLATDIDFQKKDYVDFVYNDALQMLAHMYNETNSPYYDYPGTFYYRYGDHAYPDSARAEGLIAAHYLAENMGRADLAKTILDHCRLVARSLMFTYNTDQSTFMYPDPKKGVGAFRFKLTRQWMRVDTVQHTACFFIRLLKALEDHSKLIITQPKNTNIRSNTDSAYTLFACGDTMIARWMHYHIYNKGPGWPLEDVRPLISEADLAYTNLECVVSTNGYFYDKHEARPYLYRARPEMLDVLTSAGFDLVVTANNHSMDYGPAALMEQSELLSAVNIAQVGSGRNAYAAGKPTYIQTGNIVIAFIGLETEFPSIAATASSPGVCHAVGEDAILSYLVKAVNEAREFSDLIVFTPHWGDNWTENPTQTRVQLAHKIIDLGVDAILGHSSHHVHGIEVYKGKPIVYDMGSFLFDTTSQKRMRYSAAYVLTFSSVGFEKIEIHPLLLKPSKTCVAIGMDQENIIELIKRLSLELGQIIECNSSGVLEIPLYPSGVKHSLENKPDKYYRSNRTITMPAELKEKQSNVVLCKAPAWAQEFGSVELEQGVTVIGWRAPKSVCSRGSFAMEVVIKTSEALHGNWVAHIKGTSETSSFLWKHPIADGAHLASQWKHNQIVVDRTLVRIPEIDSGVYRLCWGLINHDDMTVLKRKNAGDLSDGFVSLGEIKIVDHSRSHGMSNLIWEDNKNN